MSGETLLVGLAHPDDEVGLAGTLLAQRARGDRVVVVWLSKGEMTEAFGPIPREEVARKREEQGRRAGEILAVETRFLDFEDTRIVADRDAAVRVARVMCEVRPTGLLTWGDAWARGMRHPDHQACGRIFRDAITFARIAKVVAPLEPYRGDIPVFTLRDIHSRLPAVGVDVTPHRDGIRALARFYLHGVGFGDEAWLEHRLRSTGERWGYRYAEEFDVWETAGDAARDSLLPAPAVENLIHPTRRESHR